jgi:hypothetical protein
MVAPVGVIEMVAGERRAPVVQYPDQASIGHERRHHVFHHHRQPRAMKGGVDEQVHIIQDEGAIDVDVDPASIALELPGIETAGGRQADVAAAVMREVLRFDRDAVLSEVGWGIRRLPSGDQGRCAGRSYPWRSVPPAGRPRRIPR